MSDPVEYLRILEGEPLPDVREYAPFRAVVVIDAAFSQAWQAEVSAWLVESGCLYMMAWGSDCSSWDESVDYANRDQFDDGEIPDEHFVMTTWHDGQTLDDVFWQAQFASTHGTILLGQTLIIHIAPSDRSDEMFARFLAARDQACE
jgi:hypothetical protein